MRAGSRERPFILGITARAVRERRRHREGEVLATGAGPHARVKAQVPRGNSPRRRPYSTSRKGGHGPARDTALHGDMADPRAGASGWRPPSTASVVSTARQQCRDQPPRPPRRLRRRRLGPHVRRQHTRDLAARQGRLPRAEGVARRHRGGGVDVGLERPRQSRPLRTQQGRRHHAREGARPGARARPHPINTVSPGLLHTA